MKIFIVILLAAIVSACGGDGSGYGGDTPAPAPTPPDAEWDAIKPVVVRACGKCHNGSVHPLDFGKKAAFIGSKAKVRIENGTMPPAGQPFTAEDKAALLEYL